MPSGHNVFKANCPSRLLCDQIADKWSMLVIASLYDEPMRFNAIKRRIEGVTQKALTQTLRRLERNGIVDRRVYAGPPVAVEYRITELGRSLEQPFVALYTWMVDHMPQVNVAREAFDARHGVADAVDGRALPM